MKMSDSKMSTGKIVAIVGIVVGVVAIVTSVVTVLVYLDKKRDEAELEKYLEDSIQ